MSVSTSAGGRVKCTYADCYRHFSNEKDMKSHKKKDPGHEYCQRCDVDCADDSDLLIHMIESGRHIVCPMCGTEFKSNAGLEAHIPQTHQHAQSLRCIGCNEGFSRAAALMRHIENEECSVISQEIFQQRRAEKAITKDAWAAQLQPDTENIPRGKKATFSDSEASTKGGVALLDDEYLGDRTTDKGSLSDPLTTSMSLLSMQEQFPVLPMQHRPSPKSTIEDCRENTAGKAEGETASSAWAPSTSLMRSLPRLEKADSQQLDASTNSNMPNDRSKPSNTPNTLLSTDVNAHLQIKPAPLTPAPILDPMTCYNHLTNKFECPGSKCGGIFPSVEAFNNHLKNEAHVGGTTTCPSCLRKFGSTMALVAHCEAPSKKCNVRKSANYNHILREITGGLIGTQGYHIDGSVRYVANDIRESGFW